MHGGVAVVFGGLPCSWGSAMAVGPAQPDCGEARRCLPGLCPCPAPLLEPSAP
jgi:hypothetical protein